MRGVTNFITEHNQLLKVARFDDKFLAYHLEQIRFLQHERLVHLTGMLFIFTFCLVFLGFFFFINEILFLVLFFILLVLTIVYIFHYYRLENTVIRWYFIYNDNIKKYL